MMAIKSKGFGIPSEIDCESINRHMAFHDFNHELLPILLSLYFPISIASCNSQGSILRNIANSSITEVRINIKLGEDLLLSLDGAPIAALDDLNCVAAIFLATYKLMYRANKPSEVL